MPIYEAEGFTLRCFDLGETDKIVVLYTDKFGKIRGVAKGARRTNSRFLGALEPLTHVRVSFYQRESPELVRIIECELLRSPHLRSRDLELALYANYFCELVQEFTPERDADENLFRLLIAILDGIEKRVNYNLLARYFETWMLRLEGFLPKYETCARCKADVSGERVFFFPERSEVICARCVATGGLSVSLETKRVIARILKNHPTQLNGETCRGEHLSELEKLNQHLIVHHLGRSMNSYGMIKKLLDRNCAAENLP